MTETEDGKPISESVHDAAADWFARRQRSLDPASERAFTHWLNADPAHRAAYEEVARNWDEGLLLSQSPVGRERHLGKAPFLLRHRTQVAAAGVGVMVLVGIVAVGLLPSGGPVQVVSEARAATYETDVGEIRTVSLADGSKVTLDTRTRIDVAITETSRRLHVVRGRARFAVAPAAGRPFVVAAGDTEVRAVGTIFDVSLTDTGAKVVSIRGTVEVRNMSDTRPAAARQLTAGEQIELSPSRGISGPTPASQTEARWISGMLTLEGTPLSEAVAAINRYNRTQIRVADPELARRTITGAFRATDPNGFAAAVSTMFHARVLREQGMILLISAEQPSHPKKLGG